MAKLIRATEARSRFFEIVERVSRGRERFLIVLRGKSVAAIVRAADLARL